MSFPEGKLVHAVSVDNLRSRDCRPGPVDPILFPILATARERRGRNGEAAAEGTVVSDVLGVGVVDVEAEAMGLALQQCDLQRVVGQVGRVRSPEIVDSV